MHPSPIFLKLPRLQAGDTVGVVAPSLPLLPDWRKHYVRGADTLRSMGFAVKEGQTLGLSRWWSAGTPEQQARDINAMFADPTVKAIIAHAGGFSALAVLDFLDYATIRVNPKPFLGMSDCTIYHLAFLSRCGLIGFHTDMLTEGIGMVWPSLSAERCAYLTTLYQKVLMATEPLGAIRPDWEWESWRSGEAEGLLIGGNLKRITALAATPYFPPVEYFDGAILFWEEIGREIWDIGIDLQILKQRGVLERISGMLVGKLTWINESFPGVAYPTIRELVLDATKEYAFPIMANLDFGHQIANIPLLLGIRARLNAGSSTFSIIEAAVQ